MKEIVLEKRVVKTLERYPEKYQLQIKNKILSLIDNTIPNDSKLLVGYLISIDAISENIE